MSLLSLRCPLPSFSPSPLPSLLRRRSYLLPFSQLRPTVSPLQSHSVTSFIHNLFLSLSLSVSLFFYASLPLVHIRSWPWHFLCIYQVNLADADRARSSYRPGMFDDWLLSVFRQKMVEEVGWDSDKPGYSGLMEVVNHLRTKSRDDGEAQKAAVRILTSLFPSWLLELFKLLVSPMYGGKLAAIMIARVTALSCQWLMGPCAVNAIEISDGSSCNSGVFVERCKYLEESKCVGICIHTCKLPTQSFFGDYMGVPLTMEPNFTDYSCQFKFGIPPPSPEQDESLKEPCLEICLTATRRRELGMKVGMNQCPKV